ncbi:hypothetical protein HK104_011185, partial [Borealophlyctis nickersoniae]
ERTTLKRSRPHTPTPDPSERYSKRGNVEGGRHVNRLPFLDSIQGNGEYSSDIIQRDSWAPNPYRPSKEVRKDNIYSRQIESLGAADSVLDTFSLPVGRPGLVELEGNANGLHVGDGLNEWDQDLADARRGSHVGISGSPQKSDYEGDLFPSEYGYSGLDHTDYANNDNEIFAEYHPEAGAPAGRSSDETVDTERQDGILFINEGTTVGHYPKDGTGNRQRREENFSSMNPESLSVFQSFPSPLEVDVWDGE